MWLVMWTMMAWAGEPWQEPLAEVDGMAWPTAEQWLPLSTSREKQGLARVSPPEQDGTDAVGLLLTEDSEARVDIVSDLSVRAAFGCHRHESCSPPVDYVTVLESRDARVGSSSREAYAYARSLLRFQGGAYLEPSRVAERERQPTSGSQEELLQWALHPSRTPDEAEPLLADLSPQMRSLWERRVNRPFGMCSQDMGPQYAARQLWEDAAAAGQTGWALDALLISVDYWRSARTAWMNPHPEGPDVEGWSQRVPQVDAARWVEGLVAIVPDGPPELVWYVARPLYDALPDSEKQRVQRRVAEGGLDPLNRLVLALTSGAELSARGVLHWPGSELRVELTPLEQEVFLAISG